MKLFIKCQICGTKVQAFDKTGLQYEEAFNFRISWNKEVLEEGMLK